jgi:hypothetical protein
VSGFLAAANGPYLALYLVTLALHAAFVSYLVGGTGYVLAGSLRARRRAGDRSPLVALIASWLPLAMGAAITAGVAPLLFLQLLHQRAFYTANLLLGPIWFAMIPALIAGFYLLYLHKSRPAFHPGAVLGIALACFAVVACLWSWNHSVMTTPESWTAAYRDSVPATYGPGWLARFPLWLGAMLAQFATVALWQAVHLHARSAVPTRALAIIALGGRVLSITGACLLGWHRHLGEPLTLALVVVTAADAALWLWLAARQRNAASPPSRRALVLLTATTGLALCLAVLVREQARLPQLRRLPAAVHNAGGAWLFALFVGLALIAFAMIFRAVRNAAPEDPATR